MATDIWKVTVIVDGTERNVGDWGKSSMGGGRKREEGKMITGKKGRCKTDDGKKWKRKERKVRPRTLTLLHYLSRTQ